MVTKVKILLKRLKKLKEEEENIIKEARLYLHKKYGDGLKYQIEMSQFYYEQLPEWKKEYLEARRK